MTPDLHSDQSKSKGCAVNYCRKPFAGWLVKGDVRLALCEKHTRTYRGLGYELPRQCICDPAHWPCLNANCPTHGVPPQDLERASQYVKDRGWVPTSPATDETEVDRG